MPEHYTGSQSLAAVATASAPSLTEGATAKLSTDLSGNLRTTGGGGGGGNVTIVGPLGSQPAADSVSVALASDQLPLPITGSISVAPVYSHTLNQGGLQTVTTAAVLLADNHTGATPRVGWEIQNISTVVVLILLGGGTLSAANYTFALPACGTSADGSSPIYRDTQWQGEVQIMAATGTGKVVFGEYV
jgi:hypothetical protein